MLRQRLIRQETPEKDAVLMSEWKIATAGLILSMFIIVCKIYDHNKVYLYNLLHERKYVSYETITEEGEVMFMYTWQTFVKYSSFWFPILCGLLTTYFTWLMVYLDSNVPGVQPPSPFSPTKYKLQSGHTFHLNYVFAVIVGVFVSSYLFWRGVQL